MIKGEIPDLSVKQSSEESGKFVIVLWCPWENDSSKYTLFWLSLVKFSNKWANVAFPIDCGVTSVAVQYFYKRLGANSNIGSGLDPLNMGL